MKRFFTATLLGLLLTGPALAQGRAPAPAPVLQASPAGMYCVDDAMAADQMPLLDGLRVLRQRCQPGDIILLKGIGLIGMSCDFTRPLIQHQGNVLGLFTGGRETRRN